MEMKINKFSQTDMFTIKNVVKYHKIFNRLNVRYIMKDYKNHHPSPIHICSRQFTTVIHQEAYSLDIVTGRQMVQCRLPAGVCGGEVPAVGQQHTIDLRLISTGHHMTWHKYKQLGQYYKVNRHNFLPLPYNP